MSGFDDESEVLSTKSQPCRKHEQIPTAQSMSISQLDGTLRSFQDLRGCTGEKAAR